MCKVTIHNDNWHVNVYEEHTVTLFAGAEVMDAPNEYFWPYNYWWEKRFILPCVDGYEEICLVVVNVDKYSLVPFPLVLSH